MKRFRTAHITAVTVVCVALCAPPALAGGEPKNVEPFTRPAAVPVAARLPAVFHRPSRVVSGPPLGERKNGPPFNAAVRRQAMR